MDWLVMDPRGTARRGKGVVEAMVYFKERRHRRDGESNGRLSGRCVSREMGTETEKRRIRIRRWKRRRQSRSRSRRGRAGLMMNATKTMPAVVLGRMECALPLFDLVRDSG